MIKSLIVIILCLPSALFAETETAPLTVTFTVKPSTCVVEYRGDDCDIDLFARWQANEPVACCLYADDDQLACWSELLKGEKQFHLETDEAVEMTLVEVKSQKTLAAEQVVVQAQNTTHYRHRLKMPWSVF